MSQPVNPPPAAGMGAQDTAEREKFEREVRRVVDPGNSAGLMLEKMQIVKINEKDVKDIEEVK